MALPKNTLEKKISRSRDTPNSTKSVHARPLKRPNGECPFTEEDAAEIYRDRLDFFENEVKLPKSEAQKRAKASTDNWRREVFRKGRP